LNCAFVLKNREASNETFRPSDEACLAAVVLFGKSLHPRVCRLLLFHEVRRNAAQHTASSRADGSGVMPGFGGTWRLARRVGLQRACEMMFVGDVIDAATAKAYGLVLGVSAAGDALNSAQELAKRIAKTSRSSVAAIKRSAHAAWNLEPSQIDALEEAAFPKLFGPEQSAGIHAFLKQQEASKG
jgi:enoyl-CoA hydratase/carnithine racemase